MALKAKVITIFNGVKDGEIYPTAFKIDDVVEGKLAAVAVEQGWAIAEPKRGARAPQPEQQQAPAPQSLVSEAAVDADDAEAKAE